MGENFKIRFSLAQKKKKAIRSRSPLLTGSRLIFPLSVVYLVKGVVSTLAASISDFHCTEFSIVVRTFLLLLLILMERAGTMK
jgi:hypothetical protein